MTCDKVDSRSLDMKAEQARGYLHPSYASSLAEFGVPRKLHRSKAWILERLIPASPYRDGMGCYPIFACRDWSRLQADLDEIGETLVTLSIVTDPFGTYDAPFLQQYFHDLVVPFKQHFVADLAQRPDRFVHPHHRRYARKALRELEVERCKSPIESLDEWTRLYSNLIRRHNIRGITAFSRSCFAQQFFVPGIVAFRAKHKGETVGMLLWYVQERVGYYHLGAYSDLGYQVHASFGLFWFALEYFATEGLRWLNLGAGAGTAGSGADGLTRFKEGWSTGTRTAYFCGRIFDRQKYDALAQATGHLCSNYFPRYRTGEFA